MNHRHRKVLHAIFSHPISSNIHFKDLTAVLKELGAEIEDKDGARIGIELNGQKIAIHHAQHDLPKDEVVQVRHFLERCGIAASDFPA